MTSNVGAAMRWGVWRSDGEWCLQRVTREPWVAESKEDAEREASEMNEFATATMYGETYEARPLDLEFQKIARLNREVVVTEKLEDSRTSR